MLRVARRLTPSRVPQDTFHEFETTAKKGPKPTKLFFALQSDIPTAGRGALIVSLRCRCVDNVNLHHASQLG